MFSNKGLSGKKHKNILKKMLKNKINETKDAAWGQLTANERQEKLNNISKILSKYSELIPKSQRKNDNDIKKVRQLLAEYDLEI
jgi:gas vesicle protein